MNASNLSSLPYYNVTGNATPHNLSYLDALYASPGHKSKVLTWAIVTLLVCLVGCFNNILVLFVTWPRAGDKSGVNLLIFHFILANLLNCLIHYPIRCIMVQARAMGYVAPISTCYFIQAFNSINWMVVYWADAGLAINRCVALFLPHSYKSFSSKGKNLFQIFAMWAASTALLVPYGYGPGGYVVMLEIGHCAFRAKKSAYGSFFAQFRNAPFILAGVASVLIFGKCYFMSRANNAIGAVREGDRIHNVIRHRIRLAQMLVLTYVWSVVCNVPSGFIINSYPLVFERDPTLSLWLQTAAICQYAFSACILLLSNTKYKDRLRQITQTVSPLENTLSVGGGGGGGGGRRSTVTGQVKMSAVNSISRTANDARDC